MYRTSCFLQVTCEAHKIFEVVNTYAGVFNHQRDPIAPTSSDEAPHLDTGIIDVFESSTVHQLES